jgi:hypothetical protein
MVCCFRVSPCVDAVARARATGMSTDWAHKQLASMFDVEGYQEALRAKKAKLADGQSLFENKDRWHKRMQEEAEAKANAKYYDKDAPMDHKERIEKLRRGDIR